MLATTAAVTLSPTAFWSVATGSVPVLAFSLVLEVRRVASDWNYEQRGWRIYLSLTYIYQSLALVAVFILGLFSLATGADLNYSSFVIPTLGVVLFMLVTNPLAAILMEANADLVVALTRVPPWSKFQRNRRELKSYDRRARRNEKVARKAVRDLEELIRSIHDEIARDDITQDLRLARVQRDALAKLAEHDPQSKQAQKAVSHYDSKMPSAEDYSNFLAAMEHIERRSNEQIAKARATLDESIQLRDLIKDALRSSRITHFEEEEVANIRSMLARSQSRWRDGKY